MQNDHQTAVKKAGNVLRHITKAKPILN